MIVDTLKSEGRPVLTANERAVLDRLISHESPKQIAYELGVSRNTVDQRLRKAREKLGTTDRGATLRAYREWTDRFCQGEESVVASEPMPWLQQRRDRDDEEALILRDAAFSFNPAPWADQPLRLNDLEDRYHRLGGTSKVTLAVALAALMAVTALVVLAVANSLASASLPAFVTNGAG